MAAHPLAFSLPLESPPTLLQIGIGLHGPHEVKRYRFELWCLHLYSYTGDLYLEGVHFPIRPGYAGIMPPGVASETHFPESSRHLYAHFTVPDAGAEAATVRAMQDLGDGFAQINQAFEEAADWFSTRPRRSEALLWDILWRIAAPPAPMAPASRSHPLVQRALQVIEIHLAEPISIAAMAHELDISHNHLTRLFRASFGTTVVGYVQRRRAQRARHLLVHSSLPIKSIAAEVGIRDLNHFNKMIRRLLGASPRQVRSGRGGVDGSGRL